MRAYVAMGTLVFIIGCGGNVESEPLSTRDDAVGDSTQDASAPTPALAAPDAGPDIDACWVDTPFLDAGAPEGTVFVQPFHGDPAACGLPSFCTMTPASQALCDHLCGPGALDCYYSSEPLDLNCALSTDRLVKEWDAGYPCPQ
jgi:hypothetical protein